MKEILLMVYLAAAVDLDRGAWFKSLTQPLTGLSCCDISDCRKTKAVWQDGWWAEWNGRLTPIPKEIILERKSIDENAYLCASKRNLYCFVPPLMGN